MVADSQTEESNSNNDDNGNSEEPINESQNEPGPEPEQQPLFETSTVRIDDGGSDLTDRFKYKVNALMGVFDPSGVDDERQDGNILNAMVTFPVRFTFTAVGKTEGADEAYAEKVKHIVGSLSGDPDGLQLQVTPRGTKFTRVTAQAQVDSAAIVNSIFEALEELDMTVMHY